MRTFLCRLVALLFLLSVMSCSGGGDGGSGDGETPTPLPEDSVAPSNKTSSAFINNGNSDVSCSFSVKLTLAATDNLGVTAYYVSEDMTTPEASSSGWTTITATTDYSSNSVDFTISKTDGTKTVYVWFKDARGNISNPVSASINFSSADCLPATFTGRVQYQDKPLHKNNGFTNSTTLLPVRYADLQIINNATGSILGSSSTDELGDYSLSVDVIPGETVYVRVLTTTATSGKMVSVKSAQSENPVFSAISSVFSVQSDTNTQNITATISEGAAVRFNIFDNLINGALFIKSITGNELNSNLIAFYENRDGTYFMTTSGLYICDEMCTDNDNDGWDDSIILHEFGHYIAFSYSKDDSPGGSHQLINTYDIRLAWSEGWGTFFAATVRDFIGDPDPEYYLDTIGKEGSEFVGIAFEIETPSLSVTGADNEIAVSSLLWDIYDSPANEDTGGFDNFSSGIGSDTAGIWNVLTTYLKDATAVSLEDFWDGWFENNNGIIGGDNDISAIFNFMAIYYREDSKESNDTPATATLLTVGTAINNTLPVDRSKGMTFYPAGDVDWYKFDYSDTTVRFTIKTSDPGDGADTYMELYDTDGTTLLQSNDDSNSTLCNQQENPDCSSTIIIDPSMSSSRKPSSTGIVYVRVITSDDLTNSANYGNYNIKVTTP